MVDKREETSLVPEIKLHNKLKCSLKALLLPLLSIHVKLKTASTDFRASYRFCQRCSDWRLSLWVINVMSQAVLIGRGAHSCAVKPQGNGGYSPLGSWQLKNWIALLSSTGTSKNPNFVLWKLFIYIMSSESYLVIPKWDESLFFHILLFCLQIQELSTPQLS